MKNDIANIAITANLQVLKEDLTNALAAVSEALSAADRGERNLAIGTLGVADRGLRAAPALLDAMLAIHHRAEPQRR